MSFVLKKQIIKTDVVLFRIEFYGILASHFKYNVK